MLVEDKYIFKAPPPFVSQTNCPLTGLAGNPAETDATAFTIWNADPSWTLNMCVLAVSNQVSPLLEDVNPAGELLGAIDPIWTGPTLIKPVLGEAVLSAKNKPGLTQLLFNANYPAPSLIGKGLSFAVLDLRVWICTAIIRHLYIVLHLLLYLEQSLD